MLAPTVGERVIVPPSLLTRRRGGRSNIQGSALRPLLGTHRAAPRFLKPTEIKITLSARSHDFDGQRGQQGHLPEVPRPRLRGAQRELAPLNPRISKKLKRIVADITAPASRSGQGILPEHTRARAVDGSRMDRQLRLARKDDSPDPLQKRRWLLAPTPDLSIDVDDLHAALARIAIEYGPVAEPWGVRRFFVRDPRVAPRRVKHRVR
jgi:hypothetical protein